MPIYEFRCNNCSWEDNSYFLSLDTVNKTIEEKGKLTIPCPSCNSEIEKSYGNFGIIFRGAPSAGQSVRIKRQMEKDDEYAAQGINSMSEYKEIADMAREEEKLKGMEPNTIMGGIEAPKTKEQKAKAKEKASKKAKLAKEARKGQRNVRI